MENIVIMNNKKGNGLVKAKKEIISNMKQFIKFSTEKKWQTIMIMYALFSPINVVSGADAKWTAVINFILPWIDRLGGVVILIGAVEFGLAFKNDDAEGKTKGMRTVIAGCIVLSVGLGSNTFLY